MAYQLAADDKVFSAARLHNHVQMYSHLTGYAMYDILAMLDSIQNEHRLIDLKSQERWEMAQNRIDMAPIFKERMKIAVPAVRLAGAIQSIQFQKDYEAWLNMLPNDQRQDILKYLLARQPDKKSEIPNQLAFGPMQFTGWKIVTSAGVNAAYSYFSLGGGTIYLQQDADPRKTYRYLYGGAGLGLSWSKVSGSFSTKDMPGSGIGMVYRSGTRAADLMPSTFSGLGVLVTGTLGVTVLSGSVTMLMLGLWGTVGDYTDLNQCPQKAAAVGWLNAMAGGLGSKVICDYGISWSLISV